MLRLLAGVCAGLALALTDKAGPGRSGALADPYPTLQGDLADQAIGPKCGDYRFVAYTVAADQEDTDPDTKGWLLCDGRAVSRTTYSRLFNKVGTAYGTGDGTSTFNLPPGGRVLEAYVSGTTTVGQLLGAETQDLAHTHTLSAHTHAGPSHTHAGPSHTHTLAGSHTHDINHDHGAFTSGPRQNGGAANLGSGSSWSTDHDHSIDVPALGTTNSGAAGTGNTGSGGTGNTGSGGTGNTGVPSVDQTNSAGSGALDSRQPTLIGCLLIKT